MVRASRSRSKSSSSSGASGPVAPHRAVVLFFVSDHGFGHATRDAVVIEQLYRAAQIRTIIVSSVPRRVFESNLGVPFFLIPEKVDVGVLQRDSAHVDLVETAEALAAFVSSFDQRRAQVVSRVRECLSSTPELADAVLVCAVSDIGALCQGVAADFGVPSIALSNFTWTFIYTELANQAADGRAAQNDDRLESLVTARHVKSVLTKAASEFASAYKRFSLAIALPQSAPDMSALFKVVEPAGWIASVSPYSAEQVFERLGLTREPGVQYALLSFGGHRLFEMDPFKWNVPLHWQFLIAGELATEFLSRMPTPPPFIHVFNTERLAAASLRYVDVLAASDLVIGKLGYGLVSECIAHRRPFLCMLRPHYPENEWLLSGLAAAALPHRQVTLDEITTMAASLFDAAGTIAGSWPPFDGQPSHLCSGAGDVLEILMHHANIDLPLDDVGDGDDDDDGVTGGGDGTARNSSDLRAAADVPAS